MLHLVTIKLYRYSSSRNSDNIRHKFYCKLHLDKHTTNKEGCVGFNC